MKLITRRRVSAGLAIVLSTGVCALASHALAAGNTSPTMSVKFGAETWYQPDPTCMLPTGCVSIGVTPPAINPYGAGTLHVGVTAGTSAATETSRTYLALPALSIPAGDTITGAAFTAPLNTSTTAGSVAPDTSTTHVCTGEGTITADEGEFGDPPDTLCSADAALTYVATPTPELTGDVTSVLNAHLSDLMAGKLSLAILPLNAPATATWSDVFDSNDGSNAAMAPTLTLTFSAADASAPVVPVDTPSDTASPADAATPAASAPTGVVASKPLPVTAATPVAVAPAPAAAAATPPEAVAPAPVSAVVSAAPPPEVAASQVATAQAPAAAAAPVQTVQTVASTRTVGFAYPVVLLLPLLLIAGGAGLARIMTRDVSPRINRPQV